MTMRNVAKQKKLSQADIVRVIKRTQKNFETWALETKGLNIEELLKTGDKQTLTKVGELFYEFRDNALGL